MKNRVVLFIVCSAAWLLTGCASLSESADPQPVAGTPDRVPTTIDSIKIGDKLTIEFSDIPNPPPPFVQTVRDDGTIGLPLGITLTAAGMKRGDLQIAIRNAYVPKYYNRLFVNIRLDERYFFVGGEVKMPNRQLYLGPMTLLRAIQAAGDFNDFANRKNVQITRADGRTEIVNCVKAKKEPNKYDLPIYPGDSITVRRRYI